MRFKECLSFVFLFSFAEGKPRKNIILDFTRCKHYTTSSTQYKDFFEITSKQLDGTAIDFHFSVMGKADGHVLFASSETVRQNDSVYEVVLGSENNRGYQIRRTVKNNLKTYTYGDSPVLSPNDYRSFWIHIKEGFVALGKEGEETSILNWTNPDPLDIKVFSFRSYGNVELKWLFDCLTLEEFLANLPANPPTVPICPTLPINIIKKSTDADIETISPTSTNVEITEANSPRLHNYATDVGYGNKAGFDISYDISKSIITNSTVNFVNEYENRGNSANFSFSNRFPMIVYFSPLVILIVAYLYL